MRGFSFLSSCIAICTIAAIPASWTHAGAAGIDVSGTGCSIPDSSAAPASRLDSVIVTALRDPGVGQGASTRITGHNLRKSDPVQSLPQTIGQTVSAVATSEGGTGLGYTSLRVRGVPGSQTGVTLNGIALNDAESQEVFWVNIPSITQYLKSAEVQRGQDAEGGPGQFGAAIRLNTTGSEPDFASAEFSAGSFGTFTGSVRASGLKGSGSGRFWAKAGASAARTDGYIRNAFAGVWSCYAEAGWDGRRDALKAVFLAGSQKSGITWEGIPLERWEAGDRTYNPAGEYIDVQGNTRYYDNQTDNYRQCHIQLHHTHRFTDGRWALNSTVNRTGGYGYYEQYRCGFTPDGDAVTRDILDNTLWVLKEELVMRSSVLDVKAGAYLSSYMGGHKGETISPELSPWYSNDATKREADLSAAVAWRPGGIGLVLDANFQYRHVRHYMSGPDEYGQTLDINEPWDFVNAKAGIRWDMDQRRRIHASAAVGHREPGRADLQADPLTGPETLFDLEVGYAYTGQAFQASANLFDMEYHDMLIETGRLNDAGYAIKENTPRAWRRGIELCARASAGAWAIDGDLSLSTNRIQSYTAWLECYDEGWNYLGQSKEEHHGTDIRLSPSVIGGARLRWTPLQDMSMKLGGRYVGRQYWDNTSSQERCVPAYFVADLSAEKKWTIGRRYVLTAGAYIHNLLNSNYYAYAWVWRATVGGKPYSTEGLYPQAPINGSARLMLTF